MSKRIRQYIGIFAAVIAYYIVHEGAHLVAALHYGTFKGINFMGLGMQIDAYTDRMTDSQLGVFCLVGAVATVLFGWLLVLLCKWICAVKSKVFKAVMWYVSLAILIIDPLYLSILCGFFDGIFPEMIDYLRAHGMTLSGAVHDFTCPQTGTNYMYFPIRKL